MAAGIKRVVYIEPYPKSRALDLHEDSMTLGNESEKVALTPFVGVGPRRYVDLFSLRHGSGRRLRRKDAGDKIPRQSEGAWPRIPLSPTSYLEREKWFRWMGCLV